MLIKNTKSDIVSCDMIGINEMNNSFFEIRSNKMKNGFVEFNKLYYENFISTQMVMGKSEIFKNNKFDNSLPRFQDWDLFLRILFTHKIYFSQEKLVIQYIQSDSLSTNPQKAIIGLNEIDKKFIKQLKANRKIEAHHLYLKAVFSAKSGQKHLFLFIRSFFKAPKLKTLLRILASLLKLY